MRTSNSKTDQHKALIHCDSDGERAMTPSGYSDVKTRVFPVMADEMSQLWGEAKLACRICGYRSSPGRSGVGLFAADPCFKHSRCAKGLWRSEQGVAVNQHEICP